MNTFSIILIVLVPVVLGYLFFITMGHDNFRGITLQLDDMYTNKNEMARAVFQELKKQGRDCEILENGPGYPKLLVDGRKYLMTYRMGSIYGIPMQVVHLKICKG